MKRYPIGFAAVLAVLAACSGERDGTLTEAEERQLNEAAEMLDENVYDASPDSLVANEAEIEALEQGAAAPPPDNAAEAGNASNIAAEDGAQ